jgi:iron complex outermembrane receptor protein
MISRILLKKTHLFFWAFLLSELFAKAQTDSTRLLNEIVVKAYRNERSLLEVPASVNVLTYNNLNRFSNSSLVPAVNTQPGVRMEERSPGSYRFSIRGSSLRSPFGVRNVKFYWNGLPFTDGSGNTYLNLLDFNSVERIEVIKGPAASLYGSGTGGVVLLESISGPAPTEASITSGSFGLIRATIGATILSTEKSTLSVRSAYQMADGYREQTGMDRFTASLDWKHDFSERTTLSFTFLTSSLNYETPGGLTKSQFEQDAQQARPATNTLPGAVEQQAAVSNQTNYFASTVDHQWNTRWSTRVGIFGSYTRFSNPAIRNYEKREETNAGGRTETTYRTQLLNSPAKFVLGGEYHHFLSPIDVYQNVQGVRGNLQTRDELTSRTGLIFTQLEIDLPRHYYLTLGGSMNVLRYTFERSLPDPSVYQQRDFETRLFPRIAILKKVTDQMSVFSSVSAGFSPPTLAEVRPSTGTYNNSLQPEQGLNTELGLRGSFFNHRLRYDVVGYSFHLREAIVIQRAADGAEFFVNAGKTRQQGIEALISYNTLPSATRSAGLSCWVSYSLNHYFFEDYVQDGDDFSQNRLTGVAPNVWVTGIDLITNMGLYAQSTVTYSDHLPLNDANTEYAAKYWLAGMRAGYKRAMKKIIADFFIGVDNLLDERYSLGSDINAAGGRYYNAAPERNYYVGFTASLPELKR